MVECIYLIPIIVNTSRLSCIPYSTLRYLPQSLNFCPFTAPLLSEIFSLGNPWKANGIQLRINISTWLLCQIYQQKRIGLGNDHMEEEVGRQEHVYRAFPELPMRRRRNQICQGKPDIKPPWFVHPTTMDKATLFLFFFCNKPSLLYPSYTTCRQLLIYHQPQSSSPKEIISSHLNLFSERNTLKTHTVLAEHTKKHGKPSCPLHSLGVACHVRLFLAASPLFTPLGRHIEHKQPQHGPLEVWKISHHAEAAMTTHVF